MAQADVIRSYDMINDIFISIYVCVCKVSDHREHLSLVLVPAALYF